MPDADADADARDTRRPGRTLWRNGHWFLRPIARMATVVGEDGKPMLVANVTYLHRGDRPARSGEVLWAWADPLGRFYCVLAN